MLRFVGVTEIDDEAGYKDSGQAVLAKRWCVSMWLWWTTEKEQAHTYQVRLLWGSRQRARSYCSADWTLIQKLVDRRCRTHQDFDDYLYQVHGEQDPVDRQKLQVDCRKYASLFGCNVQKIEAPCTDI